ncbi:MAG: type II toxin-antitoxin system VapC family toxin [Chloroflexi bacterium]|nr:type II toxin-antitoxin system VapC family toxin [Chloroflexota bacterium]
MPVFYLESSALLKRYKSEKGSGFVDELFEAKTAQDVFVTSHLTVLEVNSVYRVVVLPVHDGLVADSIELLPAYPLRTADALHLATVVGASRVVGEQAFYVVSADKEIAEACASLQTPVLNPELPSALEQLHALR